MASKKKESNNELRKGLKKEKVSEIQKKPTILMIDTSLIDLTGWNPRTEESYHDQEFEEIKLSMQENGFYPHEPLLLRPAAVLGRYQVVGGHRRLRAAIELEINPVPSIIRDLSDPEAKLLLFIDNFHRKDFSPLEEAQGIKLILDDGALNQTELGMKMGKSQAYVANRLRLLDAPQELKDLIISQEITPSHANILLPFAKYPIYNVIEKQVKNFIESRPLSVKDLDKLLINVFNNYSNNLSLNLDSFSYDIRPLKGFFDFENCKDCKDIAVILNYTNDNNKHCLNKDCWTAKLDAARENFKLAEEKKVENLLIEDQIDTSKMAYGTYEKLRNTSPDQKNATWDQTACSSCDKCKKNQDKMLVCLDVKCFQKKEKAFQKEQDSIRDTESEKAWQLCDDRLKGISNMDSRPILKSLVDHGYGDAETAFSPWPEIQIDDDETEEVYDFTKIPDEDLPKAVLRLVVSAEFEYSEPDAKSMEQLLKGLGV
ncbi:MAG: ParB/RepB/Spo0J family partition protein [Candidatus Methanoperedens sp.]|nr:ParB/RepB/Spo0J family partition protein [Candidatus Methanoperedens sp.]